MRTLETSPPDVAASGVVWTRAAAALGAVAQKLAGLGREADCGVPAVQAALELFTTDWARDFRLQAQVADGIAGSLRSAAERYQHVETANTAAFRQPEPTPGWLPQPAGPTP